MVYFIIIFCAFYTINKQTRKLIVRTLGSGICTISMGLMNLFDSFYPLSVCFGLFVATTESSRARVVRPLAQEPHSLSARPCRVYITSYLDFDGAPQKKSARRSSLSIRP